MSRPWLPMESRDVKTSLSNQEPVSAFPMSYGSEEKASFLKSENQARILQLAASPRPVRRLHQAAVKVHAVVKLSRLERIKRRARWATKKLIVFTLSHVGLTVLVGLYAVAGGFIFQTLENYPAVENNPDMENNPALENKTVVDSTEEMLESLKNYHVEQLWNLTITQNVLTPDLWKKIAYNELSTYSKILLAMQEKPKIAKSVEEAPTDWNYPRALLFAITIITTIGYGDTVPKTWETKVVCMVYAVFGIPLTLLCLANIGSLMASVYRFTWKNVSHLWLIVTAAPERNDPKPETSKVRVPVLASLVTMVVYILGGAAIFSSWEGWSYLDGSYFCFITLSTVGFGDYVPGKNRETFESNFKRVVCALYLLFGLALLSMVFQLIQDTVVAMCSRYASLLGLSDSKIEQDIEHCTSQTNPANEPGRNIDIFSNAAVKLIEDAKKKDTES